jgi:hypothetical protein
MRERVRVARWRHAAARLGAVAIIAGALVGGGHGHPRRPPGSVPPARSWASNRRLPGPSRSTATAGPREACRLTLRLAHPMTTNQTSPHFAEALSYCRA